MDMLYGKTRLEALSDAIFAITMTLLVLELKVPGDVPQGQLWEVLRQGGEGWLAFLITFFIAARYWMLQHDVFVLTDRFNHHAVILTFIFLGLIAILPFSSSLVGRHGTDPLAFSLYCSNQGAIGAALLVKLEFLRIKNKLPKSSAVRYLRGRLYSLTGVTLATGAAIWFLPIRLTFVVPVVLVLLSRFFLPKRSLRDGEKRKWRVLGRGAPQSRNVDPGLSFHLEPRLRATISGMAVMLSR